MDIYFIPYQTSLAAGREAPHKKNIYLSTMPKPISSIKYTLSRMMNASSTPGFSPTGAHSSRPGKRKFSPFDVKLKVFYFPGQEPLHKTYQIKLLHEVATYNLTLTEASTEAFVKSEIWTLLAREFDVESSDIDGRYAWYTKNGKKHELKQFVHGSLFAFDGRGIKSMVTKDAKTAYIILKEIPGLHFPHSGLFHTVKKIKTSTKKHKFDMIFDSLVIVELTA